MFSLQDVDLSSIQPYLEDEAESRHDHREWQFNYGQRAFLLRARSEDARDEWVAALTAAVAQAKDPTRQEQPRLPEPQPEPEPEPEPEPKPEPAGGFSAAFPTAFPTDRAHQIGLASAMLSMQGYSPEMLMEEQQRMARLMRESSGGGSSGAAAAVEPPGSPLTESDDDSSSEFGTPTGAG